jgi:hypothetical protein
MAIRDRLPVRYFLTSEDFSLIWRPAKAKKPDIGRAHPASAQRNRGFSGKLAETTGFTTGDTHRLDGRGFCEKIFEVLNIPVLMAPALEREVKSSGNHTNKG